MKFVSAGMVERLAFVFCFVIGLLSVPAAGSTIPSFIVNSQATRIIGDTVENLDGEKMGRIRDLVVALPSGEIEFVIINTGGILGVNSHGKLVPAPFVSIGTAKKGTASLDINVRRWKEAPQFKRKELGELILPA